MTMQEQQINTTNFLNKLKEQEEKVKQLQDKNPENKEEQEEKKYEFDRLKLYFGEPYIIDEVTVLQPTIGTILEFGEKRFYSTLNIFIQNTTSLRLQLWKSGIDWNKMKNFELFTTFVPMIDVEVLHTFLPDFDIYTMRKDGEIKIILYDKTHEIEFDEELYEQVSAYIKTMFNTFPKEEYAKGKTAKELIIEEEEDKLLATRAKEKDSNIPSSQFLPLVSSYLNHPGTKYKKAELKDIGIYEFMDSIARLQTYESATAMLKGAYSGFVDSSKMDKTQLNFMREIES